MKIFSVQEMIDAEQAADAAGHSYAAMMEMAGTGLAHVCLDGTDVWNRPVVILVGSGNNGGDGLVAARVLKQEGVDVSVFCTTNRNPKNDVNTKQVLELEIETYSFEEFGTMEMLESHLAKCGVVVDALLGTGLNKPVKGVYRTVLEVVSRAVSKNQLTVVAVDCPSGMNCDTGEADEITLSADITVTFGGAKQGHFLYPAAEKVGRLVAVDIGLSPLITEKIKTELATPEVMQPLLPQRPKDGHKGTFGHVAIMAGSNRYRGAGILSSLGAFRTGSGLVSLVTPLEVRESAIVRLPEVMCPPVLDEDILHQHSVKWLAFNFSKHNSFLIGPGLANAEYFVEHSLSYIQNNDGSLVLDADGLNILSKLGPKNVKLPQKTILTPHPAEMARLLNLDEKIVPKSKRIAHAKGFSKDNDCVILLKGANTVVAAPDGRVVILPFANPLLSVAGSGDVLSGVIVSLLGQGLDPFDAAVLGGWLHGSAGELAREKFGDRGMLASELADYLPLAIQKLQAYREPVDLSEFYIDDEQDSDPFS